MGAAGVLHRARAAPAPAGRGRLSAGVFVGGGVGGPDVVGRRALEEFAVGSTHRLSLSPVMDVDGDTAGGRSSIVVLAGTAVVSTGRVHDEFRRVDGAWRIARRTFAADPAPAAR